MHKITKPALWMLKDPCVHDKVDDMDTTTSPLLSYLGCSGSTRLYPTMGDIDSLSLKPLTFKLVMLMSFD